MVTIVALKFAMSSHFPLPKKFAVFVPTLSKSQSNGASRATSERRPKTNDKILRCTSPIIGSAEALPILCVRYFRWERERERQRERRKWRHHCRAKNGDKFTLSLAKNSHNWRWAYTFPCQKFALFVSPFTFPVSPFTERPRGRHCGAEIRNATFHCQNFFRPLCSPSFKWHEPRDEWSKTQDKWSNPAQSYFVLPSKNWIKLIPKTIGNRKRDCAWGDLGW